MPAGWVAGATALIGTGLSAYNSSQQADQAQQAMDAQRPLQEAQADLMRKQGLALDKQQGYVDQFTKGEADPAFAAQLAQREHEMRGDYINALGAANTANNKARARGGPGLFANPDRADEATSRTLAQGFDAAHNTARESVRDIYGRAAGLQGGVQYGNAASAAGNAANQYAQQFQAAQTGFNQNLGTAITGINSLGSNAYLNSLSQPTFAADPRYGGTSSYDPNPVNYTGDTPV